MPRPQRDAPAPQISACIVGFSSERLGKTGAGGRLGEVIEADVIAVPVSGEQRQLVVGAPRYVAKHGIPADPHDLARHAFIGRRPSPDMAPYRWKFVERGRKFEADAAPHVTTNDMALMIRLALVGAGFSSGMEERFRLYLAWRARADALFFVHHGVGSEG